MRSYTCSQALIDNWKIWIAYEVLNQWQTVKKLPEFDMQEIVNIDSKILSQIDKDLRFKIQEQKSKTDDISSVVAEIKAWLASEITNLEKLFQNKMQSGRDKLLNLGFQKFNPQEILALLAKLTSSLKVRQQDLEEKKNFCLQQKYSAWDAYINLTRKLKMSDPESLDYQNNLEGAWQGLLVHLVAKLKVEIFCLYLRVSDNLLQQIQFLYDTVKSSAAFLSKIQQSLKDDASIEITSIPVFTYLDRIDANKQKDLLEVWISHSMNYWGWTPIVTWQQVKEKLLVNVEPIAVDFCQDFVSCFLKESENININNSNVYQFRELRN